MGPILLGRLSAVLVAARGLMITAQLASIAVDFGVANTPVTILGITAMTLPFALAVDNVLNASVGSPTRSDEK